MCIDDVPRDLDIELLNAVNVVLLSVPHKTNNMKLSVNITCTASSLDSFFIVQLWLSLVFFSEQSW